MTPHKEPPEALSLRAPPRPITRLSRRTLIVAVGVVSGVMLGTTLWSLRDTRGKTEAPTELHNTERIHPAEGLAQLPADYSKLPAQPVPKLGPPLSGDLGQAMFQAERLAPTRQEDVPPGTVLRADAGADAARAERIARQREVDDAAKAGLFFRAASPTSKEQGREERPASVALSAGERQASAPPSSSGVNLEKSPSGARMPDGRTGPAVGIPELIPARSPYTLSAGTIISAALITGVNSDLPGPVVASVTEGVYDTASGRHLLVPQGSRLLGHYDSHVLAGQKRIFLVWTQLTLPDGSSMQLDRLPAVDVAGYAGLQDEVDMHWNQLIAGAALSTLLGVGAELAVPDGRNGNDQVVVTTRESLQNSVNQVGQEFARRSMSVQPTITIRPGFPVRVMVARSLELRPYRPLFFENKAPGVRGVAG